MLNGLDLFSGIGGITLALKSWVRPVAYCEVDRYAQAVLLSRMASFELPTAAIWDDVKTLRAETLPSIDIIYGGFPCQDVSVAGARKGLDGERTGLFREAIRLIRECKPKFVFLENVPGIRKYVPSVRGELEALGYNCRDGFLSAAEVGAAHQRNRWWLLAYAKRDNLREQSGGRIGASGENSTRVRNDGAEKYVADTESGNRCDVRREWTQSHATRNGITNGAWETEPNVGRVVDGISFRMDRLKGLGNAVVPAQAKEAFKILMGIK